NPNPPQIVRPLHPSAIGGPDVDTITGAETYPRITQSESFVWGNGNTVVVAYNDGKDDTATPVCYGGISYSLNGGATFTRLNPSPYCSGHGASYGDPTVVYNANLGKWYASNLTTGCGGQGIGLWESTNGVTWTTGACAHTGGSDDRQ